MAGRGSQNRRPSEAEITNGLERNEVLTTLSLWRNKIVFAEGAKAIAEALRGNGVLKNLAISGNKIGDEGARAIGGALAVNEALTSLDVG